MKDLYNITHTNKKGVAFETGYIKEIKATESNIDNSRGVITIDASTYEKLGNDNNTIKSSIVKSGNSFLYDTSGKELSVDLEYSNFARTYRLYDNSTPDPKFIATVEPTFNTDGSLKVDGEFQFLGINYENYENTDAINLNFEQVQNYN